MSENMNSEVPVQGEVDYAEMMPLMDIIDGADGMTMWLEVPGANSSTVSVEVKNRVMYLKAVSSLRRDARAVVFKRRLQLSDGVDVEKISAKTQDGVLTVNIPKSDSEKVHKVKIS